MSSSSAAQAAKPPMRDALVAAAFQLFLERGYEQTTVDDIVALAGVGRRLFFRYFPSKEDVVFPDHERCLADMTAFLAASAKEDEPVRRVCDAARLVLRMYADASAARRIPSMRLCRVRTAGQGAAPSHAPWHIFAPLADALAYGAAASVTPTTAADRHSRCRRGAAGQRAVEADVWGSVFMRSTSTGSPCET
ncbi:TetR family transcriptional regulator [Streptomyces collinus]|uniref:TetR family transcriptional regulator n=1 Tax=Streptomyces collinus TaxID=42684 RepID=UPI00367745D0